ncbi:MAG: SIS domain-containing protein [Candidatus Marinimicrobia bacterium]|jgi:arabinose-5-phosphate isomerase|nr:SIS domain-containing protein [Candidatus Neomarinimicrobiota bacterium]MBT5995505.1 SIS domain-containing protein [Candidatus Neomarinimicrobiota bacterium]MDP6754928.1 SIS domain-containing protein [Candidatus Neomarinimicrobiota bacterium]HCI16281.1 KpsF/GutQ family sugar-phosphate isomerase [Candidatus Neomarinimicrobiota bacterium]|tara:strand:+ start:2819 stop:3409 length:591 start_codon:yes stop_codon:yes gene_type:complete
MDYLKSAKTVLIKEIAALKQLESSLGSDFNTAAELIYNTTGKVIFVGLGKSGHVARKCAATFSSLGIPSFFVHASEAFHGDFGMMSKNDSIVAFSFSGKTEDVVNVVKYCKQNNIPTIGISGDSNSLLAKKSHIHLDICVNDEADHLNLAPTSSTTNMMALCDALASSISEQKGFSRSDFHTFHPDGSLGNQLKDE